MAKSLLTKRRKPAPKKSRHNAAIYFSVFRMLLGLALVLFKRLDDLFDQLMAHHVAVGKAHHTDALDAGEHLRALFRPDLCPPDRSICVISPVSTTLEPSPKRVRTIFSVSSVAFCLHPVNQNASLSVRDGATSMTPFSRLRLNCSCPKKSNSASYKGRRYGVYLALQIAGQKAKLSPPPQPGEVRDDAG